jgi:signal transduction histidine kinase
VLVERLSGEMVRSLAQDQEHLRLLLALDPKSLLSVPLVARGELLGALTLVSTRASRIFGPSDLRLAGELAHRASLALENTRLYRVATRAIQLRDEVLGIVAHDLRNPLGAIVMQTALMRRREGEIDPRSRASAETIERAAKRMSRLIEDLLDVRRMEAGRLAVDRARVPAAEVISDVIEAQAPLVSAAGIELRSAVTQELPDVWCDRERLLQVFENLVGNAIKFTKPGGSIIVGAAPREGAVLFWVADTGAGISAEDLPHVFDRFWQARGARRAGAGLGLPIVKGIVEAHDGRVWVESAPGRGATFFFELPTARSAEQTVEPTSTRPDGRTHNHA